jgi:hypothetical protein
MIDAAFWASLRREEGYMPRISIAFLSPEEAIHPLVFERPLPLLPGPLTRVAPAVERQGIHLGVWRDQGELYVWGTTRTIPKLCFVLEVAAPGLLVVKHHTGEEAGKFVNLAVLEGDQIKIVDEQARTVPDCPALLTSLLGFAPAAGNGSANILVQLAVSMRAHGRGGILLVVPAAHESWRESIVQPISYAVSPLFSDLAQLSGETPDSERLRVWQEELSRTIDWVAGLTAVDGAVVISDRYEVLGFGAKIAAAAAGRRSNKSARRSRLKAPRRRWCIPKNLAARGTFRRRNLSMISAMPLPWWRRRTDASPPLNGRPASRWYSGAEWKRCCCSDVPWSAT